MEESHLLKGILFKMFGFEHQSLNFTCFKTVGIAFLICVDTVRWGKDGGGEGGEGGGVIN